MKSIILVLLILFIYNISFSQPEFAPIGAEWYYGYREGVQTPATGYYFIKSVKDTTIDNKECRVLHKWLTYSNGNTVFEGADYLYSDTTEQKVYRYLFEKFYLLYDFSKEKGDTITILEPYSVTESDSIQLVVDSVKYEPYSDSVRLKSLYTRNPISFSALTFSGRITEKYGNEYYLYPNNQLDCDGGCPQPLRCYSDEKLSIHVNSLACDYLYSYVNDFDWKDEIIIYPNPFTEKITVKCNDPNHYYKIELKNQQGKCFYSNSSNNFPIQLDLSNVPRGMYFICFTSTKNTIYRKIIKL